MLAAAFIAALPLCAQQPPAPCAGLPPGRHALLERLTANLNLTCEQQLKIEPLLHEEESVTKPLLQFTALSPEDQQSIMITIKLAARRQVRTLLTADQQKGMDSEVESVSRGGKKGGGKKVDPVVTFESEEKLSNAVESYAALTPQEKNTILIKVKRAALADASLPLAPDQRRKLESQIEQLPHTK
ncbi:MAG TPA: hypothetical protein VN736_12560 [Candidatus Limnocylindrales bacterium]|nr:hypothetical protein [Candidatus Limnocylindrales bacterium]